MPPAATGRSSILTALLAVGGTAAAYLAWLGWDQQRDVQPDGSSTGPYRPWHVVGLVLTLAAITWSVSTARARYACCALITITLTVCFGIDAATDPDGDGLWVIGAAGVLLGTGLGTILVASLFGSAGSERTTRRRS